MNHQMHRSTHSGFTLIELMIVIAVLAILAAIAIPAYQDHVARAQVSEGLSLAAGAKVGVSDSFSDRAVFPTDNFTAGLAPPASIKGRFVDSVEIQSGTIRITFGASATQKIAGRNIILSPLDHHGSLQWRCSAQGIEAHFLPSSCR